MRSFLPNHALINAITCCANCHKEAEPFKLKMCTACRSVCYCNIDCQKAHRKNHKHQCNQGVKYLKEWVDHLATKHHEIKENIGVAHNGDDDDEDEDEDDELFEPIPPQVDCPICILPLPVEVTEHSYVGCCGNFICHGCSMEDARVTLERGQIPRCPFCREPGLLLENEDVIRIKRRMEMHDSSAIHLASCWYRLGEKGLPRDPQLAFDLSLRAAELGNSDACGSAAIFYMGGYGSMGGSVPKDMTKAREYLKMSAKSGGINARHNLGMDEYLKKGNYRLACRHWLISAAAGYTFSLEEIAELYKIKLVTQIEYSIALASYRNVHKNEWSIERERAAAAPRFHC